MQRNTSIRPARIKAGSWVITMAPVLIAVLASSLAGCASFEGAPPRSDGEVSLESSDKLYHTVIENYYRTDDPTRRAKIRNRFIEVRAGLIDRKYATFKREIYTQRVGSDVGVDVATMGLNAIGAAVSDVGAKTALHALSGGLIGSKASIDKNVYFDRTLPAMLAQMDGLRAKVRIQLLNGMLVDSDRYPLMQAAADLEDYYAAGTIPGAIAGITTQASVELKQASAKLEGRLPDEAAVTATLKSRGFMVLRAEDSDTGTALMACLSPGGKPNDENQKALETWLRAENFALDRPFALTDFLTQPVNEPLRKKALADAALQAAFVDCN